MKFRSQVFEFDSPAAAVGGFIARLGTQPSARRVERCVLAHARGRILAEPVTADRDSPAFDYAAMDGYAVRLADLTGMARDALSTPAETMLPVSAEARIGAPPPAFPPSPSVVRIATGAAIPPGADAVIQREAVVEHADGRITAPRPGSIAAPCVGDVSAITIPADTSRQVRPGDFMRRRGENARVGDVILSAGVVLTGAAMGSLACVGRVTPRVYSPVRVAIISTGDELVSADSSPHDYQNRDSNAVAVQSILDAHTWIEIAWVASAPDDEQQLAAVLHRAIARADAIVLTGGVSMGHRDPVRGAVETLGAEIVFHGLPQRPGKPMLGAMVSRPDAVRVPIFGLPGNPVSAMVTCTRVVVHVLAACAGAARWPSPPRVALAESDGQSLDLWWHRLVRLNARGDAELVDVRGSGDVIAGGRSDGFIEVPPGVAASAQPSPASYAFYAWPT